MGSEVASPLRDIIRRAAERKVEGPAAKMRLRMDNASDAVVVLADISDSMRDLIGNANLTKYQHLQIALEDVMTAFPKIRLVVFGSYPKEVAKLPPQPSGSTNLAGALEMAAEWKPRKTIVISDGLPDNGDAAIAAADKMTGAIDTIYCGPDAHPAVQFLQRLAKSTGGQQVTWDGYKPIASCIRGFLPAPE